LSVREENKLNKNPKIIVRAAVAILTVLVVYLSIFWVDSYYAKHFVKNHNIKMINKIETAQRDNSAGKIKQFDLIIAKIGVSVPVAPNVEGSNEEIYTEALKGGVAHYKGTALPASGSNVLIFGHSSGVWGAGSYSTIFSRLDDLEINDEIKILFNNKENRYLITEKKIIKLTDFSVTKPTEREQLTLMTCWPIGTDRDRLVVIATPYK